MYVLFAGGCRPPGSPLGRAGGRTDGESKWLGPKAILDMRVGAFASLGPMLSAKVQILIDEIFPNSAI